MLTKSTNLPSFICIGGQRCGSTWLHHVLSAHPQVILSPKESSFFNLRIRIEGIEWYKNLFKSTDSSANSQLANVVRGDITPTYCAMFPYEVELTKKLVPDLKVLFIIRNPVDRMISKITRQWTYLYIRVVAK